MLNTFQKILYLTGFYLLPFISFAQTSGGKIVNPLKGVKSINDVFLALLNVLIQIGIIAVVFFIVYSGFKMVMARGNPEELQKAKNMLWYTLIGGAIVLGAEIIQNVLVNTINQIGQ